MSVQANLVLFNFCCVSKPKFVAGNDKLYDSHPCLAQIFSAAFRAITRACMLTVYLGGSSVANLRRSCA